MSATTSSVLCELPPILGEGTDDGEGIAILCKPVADNDVEGCDRGRGGTVSGVGTTTGGGVGTVTGGGVGITTGGSVGITK